MLFDAITSGGLLLAVPEEHVDRLLKRLEENKTPAAAVVGRIQEGEPGKIVVLSRKIAVSSRG